MFITDEELLDVILKHKLTLYRMAYVILENHADAEDAVGDTIKIVYEKRHQLRKKESAKAWMVQILVNVSKRKCRERKHIILVETPPEKQMEGDTELDEVWGYVCSLPKEFRDVVALYYYDAFSVDEISKILKVPIGTVKSRLSRARQRLYDMVSKERS